MCYFNCGPVHESWDGAPGDYEGSVSRHDMMYRAAVIQPVPSVMPTKTDPQMAKNDCCKLASIAPTPHVPLMRSASSFPFFSFFFLTLLPCSRMAGVGNLFRQKIVYLSRAHLVCPQESAEAIPHLRSYKTVTIIPFSIFSLSYFS